jgi:hypothetical protein
MSRYFTGIRLWAIAPVLVNLIIAIIVPRQFDSEKSLFWLWILVPPAIVLGLMAAVFFAFIFAPTKTTNLAFQVSRFSRIAAVLLTAGSGYMDGWFLSCASENGCSARFAFVPGVVLLMFAWFVLCKFHNADSIIKERTEN